VARRRTPRISRMIRRILFRNSWPLLETLALRRGPLFTESADRIANIVKASGENVFIEPLKRDPRSFAGRFSPRWNALVLVSRENSLTSCGSNRVECSRPVRTIQATNEGNDRTVSRITAVLRVAASNRSAPGRVGRARRNWVKLPAIMTGYDLV